MCRAPLGLGGFAQSEGPATAPPPRSVQGVGIGLLSKRSGTGFVPFPRLIPAGGRVLEGHGTARAGSGAGAGMGCKGNQERRKPQG